MTPVTFSEFELSITSSNYCLDFCLLDALPSAPESPSLWLLALASLARCPAFSLWVGVSTSVPARSSTAALGPLPAAPTSVDSDWVSNASGNWSNAANWLSGFIADGAGASASFDTLNITTNVTVTLDTSRTIGSLYVGDING